MKIIKQLTCVALAVVAAISAMTAAADSRESKAYNIPLLASYKHECAACHMAYPAGMLPAGSWKRLMGGLNKHYGTDASLDEKSLAEISGWLNANAGTYKRVSEMPQDDRITKSAWFIRKHNEREISPAVWKRASVGSASNCIACHTNAAEGSFSEREIKIPK
jgi:mono/diheme cytochrome c family protein